MKVKELIKILNGYDPEISVHVVTPLYIEHPRGLIDDQFIITDIVDVDVENNATIGGTPAKVALIQTG